MFKIEIRGAGVQHWEFASKQEAEQFAAACFWWGGRQYRIFKQAIVAKEDKKFIDDHFKVIVVN